MRPILKSLLVFVLLAAAGFAQAPDFAETKKKAEAGDAAAQYNLGLMYARGDDVTNDFVEAAKWLDMAAEQYFSPAQFMLGVMYKRGNGVAKDSNIAVKFFQLGALQGNADAQYSLGGMYAFGDGIEKDLVQAHFWINEAAHENADAKKSLALVESQMTGAQISEAIEKEKRFNQAHALLAKLLKKNTL